MFSSHTFLSLSRFCELVNSLLQQAKEPTPDLDHLTGEILEVSPCASSL